jgi:hypothetical protein
MPDRTRRVGLKKVRDAEKMSGGGRAVRDPWAVGVYAGRSPLVLRPAAGVVNPVLTREDVTDAAADFVADPFMLNHAGRWFMFFEVLNRRDGRGEIGLATSLDGLAWDFERVVLREAFHLSYPHVFEAGGEFYMTPETLGAGAVRLYKAARFPYDWSHVADLIAGEYADPTVFFHGGRWNLFACATPQQHDSLALFRADELRGPWAAHPASPVITGDNSRARPAGRVVADGGRVIRFAQDCSARYGWRVRAFEVRELSATRYAEEECAGGPVLAASGRGWNGRGMHHLDAHRQPDGSWLACVDGHALPDDDDDPPA